MIDKIISGGQTGADTGGLRAAKKRALKQEVLRQRDLKPNEDLIRILERFLDFGNPHLQTMRLERKLT